MANRYYAAILEEASDGIGVTIFRDPATVPVDNTSPSGATSARVGIPWLQGQGFDGPNTDGGHNVVDVTGATNATPIVLTLGVTAASIGLVNGDYVYVKSVGGNTNANGTFEVTVSGSTATLIGSAGNAAYTSGGKLYKLNKAKTYKVALEAVARAISNDKSQVG